MLQQEGSHNPTEQNGGQVHNQPCRIPSVKTVPQAHIYHEQKSAELQTKRVRSNTNKKGAINNGVHAPAPGSKEHETIMRGQMTFNKFRVTT